LRPRRLSGKSTPQPIPRQALPGAKRRLPYDAILAAGAGQGPWGPPGGFGNHTRKRKRLHCNSLPLQLLPSGPLQALPQVLPAAGATLPFIIRYSLQASHGAQAKRSAVDCATPLAGVCARWRATLRSQRTTAPTPLRLCVVPLPLYRALSGVSCGTRVNIFAVRRIIS